MVECQLVWVEIIFHITGNITSKAKYTDYRTCLYRTCLHNGVIVCHVVHNHLVNEALCVWPKFNLWNSHKTLAVEKFGGLLPISILVDETLMNWLSCTSK